MGSYWRQYKSSLTTDLRKIMDQGVDVKKKIADLKPPNLKDEEWVAFSKQQCSYESRVVSEKFSAMRKMQNMQHTMGRKGYARLEDEMIESNKSSMITRVDVWTRGHIKKNGQPSNATVGEKMEQLKKCSELSSNATSIKDDAITQILGPEKRGHVRGLGFGATPSKVDMQMRTNSIVKGLHEEMMVLKATCMELKTIVLQNMSMGMKPNEGHASGGDETMNVSQSFPEDSQHDNDDGYSDSHVVNKKCKLLSWMGTGEVVAEGSISSTNPHDTVHHMVLGPDFWRVWVDHVLVEGVELLRPTSEMSVLDEAVGSTIAWPSKYISSL